jgi:hypothetical protein
MERSETVMLIHLDEYRKTKATRTAVQDRHREERESINVSAVATASAISCFQRPAELSPELPEDLTSVDLDKVLGRIYALASQF